MPASHLGFTVRLRSARCYEGAVWLGQRGCQPVGEARAPAEQRVNPSVAGSCGRAGVAGAVGAARAQWGPPLFNHWSGAVPMF